MKQVFKTAKQFIFTFILSITLFFGIFQDFVFPWITGDGMYQTLDEIDPPSPTKDIPKN